MISWIWVFRFFIIFLLVSLSISLLLYICDPVTYEWCNEKFTAMKQTALGQIVRDEVFHIPENHRRPTQRMKDFYAQQEQILLSEHIQTRQQYPHQYFSGSVFTDGFHINLPPRSKWRKGIIDFGPDIDKELEKIEQDKEKQRQKAG